MNVRNSSEVTNAISTVLNKNCPRRSCIIWMNARKITRCNIIRTIDTRQKLDTCFDYQGFTEHDGYVWAIGAFSIKARMHFYTYVYKLYIYCTYFHVIPWTFCNRILRKWRCSAWQKRPESRSYKGPRTESGYDIVYAGNTDIFIQ